MAVQAEARGFLLAYACGWTAQPSWNAGTCCGVHNNDDVQFTRDMVAALNQRLCIDSNRIFSTGFSNGGMMSNRLACEARDLFRGVAGVAGSVVLRPGNDAGLTLCDQSYAARPSGRNVHYLQIHGTADSVVPYNGNGLLGFPPARDNWNRWARRNACQGQSRQTYNQGAFSNQVFDNCAGRAVVELVTWNAGGHTWPRVGAPSNFNGAAYIVDFFRRVSGPWPFDQLENKDNASEVLQWAAALVQLNVLLFNATNTNTV